MRAMPYEEKLRLVDHIYLCHSRENQSVYVDLPIRYPS